MTTEHTRVCPLCHGEELVKDYKREETYCNDCGLVLTSAFQYVGLEKVDNIVPFSAPASARKGIHTNHRHRNELGKNPRHIKNYRHSIPNSKLMIKGRG